MTTVIKDKILRSDLVHYDGREKTMSRKDSTGGTITGLKHGVEVDVLQVYGGGTDYNKSTIDKAVAAIGSASVTLVFNPGTWTIDDNLTVASNFVIRVPAGAIFSVNSGKTLTFSGPVIRDAQTWTGGSGTVTENGTRYFSGGLDLSSAVLQGASPLVFEGATADAFETTFAITDPTADRTITFADASGTVFTTNDVATQSNMETATSTTTVVTPGRVQYHPGVAKAFAYLTVSGGTPSIQRSHNVTSVTDNGTGDLTITFTTAFSDGLYALAGTTGVAGATTNVVEQMDSVTRSTTAHRLYTANTATNTPVDVSKISLVWFGDQ